MHANKVLTPYGLQLYLYLASNLNDYQFALSPAAAEEYAGIRSTSFHKYFRLLEIKGYVAWRHGNVYDFYPTHRPAIERTHLDKHCDFILFEDADSTSSPDEAPIDNISSTDFSHLFPCYAWQISKRSRDIILMQLANSPMRMSKEKHVMRCTPYKGLAAVSA